ncbi:hypothetical protein RA307_13585 [Xanthobacteraceae bacterium Astr-EGSB]|uniref:hypothetical protein n=1 Tax=Astrobacterium formosum TaxID=3069710 RepID=UPI0027B2CEF5|nr:hypothetical protein [Xanthobacteraceae bacterium Astr-EGSB]
MYPIDPAGKVPFVLTTQFNQRSRPLRSRNVASMMEGCEDSQEGRSGEPSRSVLFIDQSTARDHAVAAVLQRHNFLVTSVKDVRCAFETSVDRKFDLVVLGYIVASTPALPDLIQSIRTRFSCPLICVGSHVTPDELAEIIAAELLTPGRRRRRRRVPKP